MGMGASMKSDHIKMKAVQESFPRLNMSASRRRRRTFAVAAMAIVLMSVLVPAINGLSSDTISNDDSPNRGMWNSIYGLNSSLDNS